jgi:hypothetical protein
MKLIPHSGTFSRSERKEASGMPTDSKKENPKLYSYWMRQLKRAAKKMPTDDWDAAKTRLSARQKDDNGKELLPVVNDLRNHIEGSRAFLDQCEPSFRILPPPQFRMDEAILKRAECERAYLEAVWKEQRCQRAESLKLNSALTYNIGFTMPIFDVKKWMPAIRYLSAENVRLDPDCKGVIDEMKWWGYKETMSLIDFTAQYEISKSELESLKQKGNYSLDKDDIELIDDDEKCDYSVVTVWHIYAKNSSALQMDKKEETTKTEKNQLKEDTVYRYLCFAEGLYRPIKDVPDWPFKLDHNENILSVLLFNKLVDDLYGFTDYRQMERMDKMKDNVMGYIEADAYFSAIRKYLGGDDIPSDTDLDAFINDVRRMVIPKMLDDAGQPKLKEVSLRQANPALTQQYELMHDQAMRASGQSELMAESTADLKEVTAMGVRYQEQKLHQRVNLRLGGPSGYEESICEDAIKILEIAHQYVPRYSEVLQVMEMEVVDGSDLVEKPTEQIVELPWPQAQEAVRNGATLLKLGVDAIVGEELAQYWVTLDDVPLEEIRLSTRVSVIPGSTRSITQEQQAADMQDMYVNVLFPTIYQPMNRIDLASSFVAQIGKLKGVDNMEDYLPQLSEIQQFAQQQMEAQQQQQQMEAQHAGVQMEMEQQKAGMEQQKSEMDLQNTAVKNDLDIKKQTQLMEIKREQALIQAKASAQKASKPER